MPSPFPARRGVRVGPGGRGTAGTVTAEFAVTLTALVFVLLIALTAVATGVDQVQCAEASRVGARLAARAEPAVTVVAAAAAQAPRGSSVSIITGAEAVTVTVRAPRRPLFAMLGINVAASGASVAPREPFHGS